jgi:hypothetical protein
MRVNPDEPAGAAQDAGVKQRPPMSACLIYAPLSPADLVKRWDALPDQPGLPDRYEMDEFGDVIEMIAPKTPHQRIVNAIQRQIESLLGGEALPGVEVLSPDNRRREIEDKTRAYLEAGAQEVIVVETGGRIRYVGAQGERPDSAFGLKLVLPAGTYPL